MQRLKRIKSNKAIMNVNLKNDTVVKNDSNVSIKYLKLIHYKMLQKFYNTITKL